MRVPSLNVQLWPVSRIIGAEILSESIRRFIFSIGKSEWRWL
jgi:hypothetical protein